MELPGQVARLCPHLSAWRCVLGTEFLEVGRCTGLGASGAICIRRSCPFASPALRRRGAVAVAHGGSPSRNVNGIVILSSAMRAVPPVIFFIFESTRKTPSFKHYCEKDSGKKRICWNSNSLPLSSLPSITFLCFSCREVPIRSC